MAAIKALDLYSIDSAALSGNYDPVMTSMPEACFMIRLVNDSNVGVLVSYDGAYDMDYLRANSDIQIMVPYDMEDSIFRKGMGVWLQGAKKGTGYIYVTGYYVAK